MKWGVLMRLFCQTNLLERTAQQLHKLRSFTLLTRMYDNAYAAVQHAPLPRPTATNVSTKHMKDDMFGIVLLSYVISQPYAVTLLASPHREIFLVTSGQDLG